MKSRLLTLALAACWLPLSAQPQADRMDSFVDSLMARMTIQQKIGQLNLHSSAGFVSALRVTEEDENVKLLRAGNLGGMYGSSDVAYLTDIQKIALQSGAGIPLIFGMDVIHGHETVMPIPLGLSATWNMDLIARTARTAAKEASALGVNWVFSPMVDICRDARWGRIAEGGGEDPYLGGEIAKAYVRGYQGDDSEFADDEVMVCVKHYALYGAAEAGRDYNTVNLGRQEVLNGYMRPYAEAAKAGAGSYMSSFNEFEGVPATMNSYLMDELLRREWGFGGFIVTDATAIREEIAHGIGDLQEVSARSLKAGIDMDMNSDGFVGTLMQSLAEGRVNEEDINQACRRILEAKYKLGLFADPFKYLRPERKERDVFTVENRRVAYEAALESQVLLKNNGVLPLRKNARIAVVGPLANNAAEMAGCWAMSSHNAENITFLQGIRETSEGAVSYARGSNVMNDEQLEYRLKYGLRELFMPGFKGEPVHTTPQKQLIAEAVKIARKADVVVACVGELNNMSGEGASRTDIRIPDAQRELLQALKATGKPIVLVLSNGRPLDLTWEDEHMDAILATWSLGTEAGHALADILYGKANPSGKLTVSFPRSVGQMPLYYNHKNTGRPHPDYEPYRKFTSCYIDCLNGPLYPFGYGLHYGEISYGKPYITSPWDGSAEVAIELTNNGSMPIKETVQLYIHAVHSTSTRPVKELRAFEQVSLAPGEKTTVRFRLTADDLAYYNHDLQWVCEPGEYEIMLGPNSRDVQTVQLTVKD